MQKTFAKGPGVVGQSQNVLLIRSAAHLCALPLCQVVETMRPLPIRPIPGMPDYVEGVATVRGHAIPVVRLAALFCAENSAQTGRFVVVRVNHRQAALAVGVVVGVFRLDSVQNMPPLLTDSRPELISGLAHLDQDLIIVLQACRIVPDEVFTSLERQQV